MGQCFVNNYIRLTKKLEDHNISHKNLEIRYRADDICFLGEFKFKHDGHEFIAIIERFNHHNHKYQVNLADNEVKSQMPTNRRHMVTSSAMTYFYNIYGKICRELLKEEI